MIEHKEKIKKALEKRALKAVEHNAKRNAQDPQLKENLMTMLHKG